MSHLNGITLRILSGTAKADVVVDGETHRDLILHKRSITWPSSKLPPSTRERLEPQIRRAYSQWLDLAGDGA